MSQQSSQVLNTLTALRFYAALVVLLRHIVPEVLPLPILSEIAAIGPIGVGFFFVLSGFILTWTADPQRSRLSFYGRRVARIYPLHLLTTALAVAVAFLMEAERHWGSTWLSVLLLQSWGPDDWRLGGNGPSWSLSDEAFFYLCFPFIAPVLLKLSLKQCTLAAALLVLMMVGWTCLYGLAALADVPAAALASTYTNPIYRLGEFAIGILLAAAMQRGWRLAIPPALVIATGVLGYVGLALVNGLLTHSGFRIGDTPGLPLGVLDLAFLPFACLLIAGAATADLRGQDTGLTGKWHIKLGHWSFALYLVQMCVIVPVVALLPANAGIGVRSVAFLVASALCILAAGALYEFVERPAERWLKTAGARWFGHRQAFAPAQAK